jgi:hypothetical protein
MLKAGSGRKTDDTVWKYFQYESSKDISTCIVDMSLSQADSTPQPQQGESAEGGMSKHKCGATIKGKNATNLKNHIRYKHKELMTELEKSQRIEKRTNATNVQKVGASLIVGVSVSAPQTTAKTISSMFMKQKKKVWEQDSLEASKRDIALTNLFIGTQLSTQLATYKEFQEFCEVLDPKYTVPGKNYFLMVLRQLLPFASI